MSFAWKFMREAHSHVADGQFLAAANPDRPNLPAYFFYSAPLAVVLNILSEVSTETTLDWLRDDNLLAYRFLGAPWPVERTNAAALMDRALTKPVPNVMLALLEREFGVTGDTEKMQCVQQFRGVLREHFGTWVATAGVDGVKSLFDRMFRGPAFGDYVLVAGGVVFKETDGKLLFTSVVEYHVRGSEAAFGVIPNVLRSGRNNGGSARLVAHSLVRNVLVGVAAYLFGNRNVYYFGNFRQIDGSYTFDPSMYELERTDAGALSTYTHRGIGGVTVTAKDGVTRRLPSLGPVEYTDYETVVMGDFAGWNKAVTILHRYAPEENLVFPTIAPGVFQYTLPGVSRLAEIKAVYRLDRVRSGDAFSLAIRLPPLARRCCYCAR
jgi:hypothetical protein